MALVLKIRAEQYSKSKIDLYCESGAYDASSNPTGFGNGVLDPNPDISEIADIGDTKGIVIMLTIGGSIYTWDDTAAILLRGWPNIYNQKLILEASSFGLIVFPDGKCEVTVRISGEFTYFDGSENVVEGFVAEDTEIIYLTKVVQCCVEKLAAAIPLETKIQFCENKKAKAFNYADLILKRMIHSIEARAWADANQSLSLLQEVCLSEGVCGCDS